MDMTTTRRWERDLCSIFHAACLVTAVATTAACGSGDEQPSGSGGAGNTAGSATGGSAGGGGTGGSAATGGTGGAGGAGGSGGSSASGGAGGTGGASASGGTSGSGSGGAAGASGSASDAGTDAPVDGGSQGGLGEAGQPCAPVGAYACAGHAQAQRLVCDASGVWVTTDVCPTGALCDTSPGATQGRCRAVVPDCAGLAPDAATCSQNGRSQVACGPDLVTAVTTPCASQGTCATGACACNTGFSGDGLTCDDVDECATSNGGCSPDADCVNTVGARACVCRTGYSGDGVACADIDECQVNNGGCSPDAACNNTLGGRDCTCNSGYGGDGVACADIDECQTNHGGCSPNANCANSTGSHACACKPGFDGDGITCDDIDECASSNGGCSPNANCTNTTGSRNCVCKPGYGGDGVTCDDIDECAANNGGCSPNANCTNTTGSRSCACKPGYGGDGVTCDDIDECAANNGGCSAHGTCTNSAGSHSCACNPGYAGDGYSCQGNCNAGRFVVPGNGTVYDTFTGLTWLQAVDTNRMSWTDAANLCGNAGYRVPTIDELSGIVDASSDPAISSCAFPNHPYTYINGSGTTSYYLYWSSSAAPCQINGNCSSSCAVYNHWQAMLFGVQSGNVDLDECATRFNVVRCVK